MKWCILIYRHFNSWTGCNQIFLAILDHKCVSTVHIVFTPNKLKYCFWKFCSKSHFLTHYSSLSYFHQLFAFIPMCCGIRGTPLLAGNSGQRMQRIQYSCRRLRGAFMNFKQLWHYCFNIIVVFLFRQARLMSRHNNYSWPARRPVINLQVHFVWVSYMILNELQVLLIEPGSGWSHGCMHLITKLCVFWYGDHSFPSRLFTFRTPKFDLWPQYGWRGVHCTTVSCV